MMTNEKTVDREEFQTQELIEEEHPKQKAVEMVSEEKPEAPGTVTMIHPPHRWQREWLDTDYGEQAAGELPVETKVKAEANAAEMIAEARRKADQTLRDAEKLSAEIADTIVAEAETKSNEIINDSRRKADEILSETKKAAAEVRNKANVEAIQQADEVINKAREKADEAISQAQEKADQIIQEAREVASDIVMLNKPEKAEGKITGREILISSALILIGIVVIVSAFLYVRYHG
jgi:vacuolar-type H+-ATPase subunit H